MNVIWITRSKTTRAVLQRARAALPPPAPEVRAQFEAAVAGFHDFIDYDELELALDELCAAAELVQCPAAIWRDLEHAARLMKLYPRAAALRRTTLATVAAEKPRRVRAQSR